MRKRKRLLFKSEAYKNSCADVVWNYARGMTGREWMLYLDPDYTCGKTAT